MKRWFVVLVLALGSLSLAQQITVSVPVLTVTGELRISLVPNLVVVQRVPEPQGIVVVYVANRIDQVFIYHDRDLRARGWQRVKYESKKDGYKAEYRRGKAKARLEVKDKKGRVEVKVKEG
jgi:hypothetical protein